MGCGTKILGIRWRVYHKRANDRLSLPDYADPEKIKYSDLLKVFWESHDPTQGMRQGNDVGTQYRSGIYTYSNEQYDIAIESKQHYSDCLGKAGKSGITTEIINAPTYYYAEEYHQQYLAKNPNGYCGLGGTGVSFLE